MEEISLKNNQASKNLNDKLLEIMNDRGIKTSYPWSPYSKITDPECTSQFNFLKDSNSNRTIDLLI